MIPLTPWVLRLLLMNGLVYLLVPERSGLYYQMALIPTPEALLIRPWTGITYQFLHAGFGHLFFNMLGLYIFGSRLEERMGSRHFLGLYLLSGLGGAVLSLAVPGAASTYIVGASGAVLGVMAAYATLWPRAMVMFFPLPPLPAWVMAVIMAVLSLRSGLAGGEGNIAHFAHLGGLVVGFAYLKTLDWRRGAAKREFRRKLETPIPREEGLAAAVSTESSAMRRWERIDASEMHELNREEWERLMEKARTHGVKALTMSERQFLDRMVQT